MSTKNFSILVAIDGSESSMKAVDYAIELNEGRREKWNPEHSHNGHIKFLQLESICERWRGFIFLNKHLFKVIQ